MSDSEPFSKRPRINLLPDLEQLLRYDDSKNDISSKILGYLTTKELKEFRFVNTFCEGVTNAKLFENSKLSMDLRSDESISIFKGFLHKFIGKPAQVKVMLGSNPKAKALLKCWLQTNGRNILSLEVDFTGNIDYELFGDFLPNLRNLIIFTPAVGNRNIRFERLDLSTQDSHTILSNLVTLSIPFRVFTHCPFARWFAKVDKMNLRNIYSAWRFDFFPTTEVIKYYEEYFPIFMTPRHFDRELARLWMTASVENPENP